MIDFQKYTNYELSDVAEFERAKKDHIYPAGSSLIQVSATNGQILFLDYAQAVEEKYVVIIPQAGIDMKYFNIVLQKNVAYFCAKYQATLNIQINDLAHFPIQLHNLETQQAIAKMFSFIEDKEQETQENINNIQNLKKHMLRSMMV